MKTFVKLIIALVVVILLVVSGLLYYVDSMAKKAIEYGGSEALGVATTLDQVNISLFSGTASLSGLKIANPNGFKPASFLRLGSGELAVSLDSLSGDTVVIPKVRLANIQVNLVQKDGRNNIEPLLSRVKSMSGTEEKQPASDSTDSGKKFILEYLEIDNVQVKAALDFLGRTTEVKMILPKIELRDLGKAGGGLSMPQLLQQVVQVILNAAAQSSGNLSPELTRLLKGQLAGLGAIKAKMIDNATTEVEKQLLKVQQQVDKQLEQVPIPAGTDKVIGKETKQLLKGARELLGN